MKFNRQIQLLEQLLDRVEETTDDENIESIRDEITEMKKDELVARIELIHGLVLEDEENRTICWSAYLLGAGE